MDKFDLRLWPGFKAAGGDITKPAIIDQVTIDSRRIDSKNALFVALEGKNEDGHKYIPNAAKIGASFILAKKNSSQNIHKEFSENQELLKNTTILFVDSPLIALQQISKSYRSEMPCKIIAIAGSHGKTMVKDLLFQMLETKKRTIASPESFNSQIGVALSLLTIRKSHEVAIIEAGISEKNEMAHLSEMIDPDFTIVTHIGKKHMTTLGDLLSIASETVKILPSINKKEAGWALIPEDPYLLKSIDHLDASFHFWTKPSKNLPVASFTTKERKAVMPYRVNFPDGYIHEGETTSGFYYFLDLINIAVKAASLQNIPSEAIAKILSKYSPDPVRIEIWKSPIGATFINETYCSDPQSIERSMKHFTQIETDAQKIFLFGGMQGDRQHIDSDYKNIAGIITKNSISRLILFGPHQFSCLIHEIEALQKVDKKLIKIDLVETFEEALNLLTQDIKAKDVVLIKGDRKFSTDIITEAFNDSVSSNQCLINLAAIGENIQAIRYKIPPHTRVMVMVKALAYGTDEVRMAKFLETCGIDMLGVSYVDEGVALKRSLVKQEIFVINAAPYEAAKIVKWDLSVGVSDSTLIEAINKKAGALNKIVKVHLHVDTGMSRFGCRLEDALTLAKLITTSKNLKLDGIMTHFAAAEDVSQDPFTKLQAENFQKAIDILLANGIDPTWKHAANSAGALRFNFPKFNMVRIGLAVYGLHSSLATKEMIDLRLSLSLLTRIAGINRCKKGETISYSRTYQVDRDEQKIAVLPIGYFDGLHRNYSGKGIVKIRGQKAPMVGKICMDFMMIDVTDIDNVNTGDQVLIFGEDEHGAYLSPEDLATSGSSIIHELITCLGPRIQRIFIYEEALRNH